MEEMLLCGEPTSSRKERGWIKILNDGGRISLKYLNSEIKL